MQAASVAMTPMSASIFVTDHAHGGGEYPGKIPHKLREYTSAPKRRKICGKGIGHIAMAGFTSGEALKLFDTCVCANGSLGFRGGDRAHLYFIQDKEEAPPKEKSFFSRKKPFPETKTCPLTDFCVLSRFIQVRA